jgi:SAM-dependent methyltransferase
MHFSWHYAGSGATGSVHPAWTETGVCQICKLNSRMRAVFSYIRSRLKIDRVENVYISEQSTDFYSKLVAEMPGINVVGSEYLGADYARGEVVSSRAGLSLRNEDLTKLSFEDECFDLVISQDVFEHIPDYRKALSEIRRVLRNDGVLLFTIPFFHHMEKTQIRAIVKDGAIEHLLPAEIHGNPVSSEGSLCFQNFGWDILDDLRAAGFANVAASMYWAPWQGHMGTSFFVFSATKQLR